MSHSKYRKYDGDESEGVPLLHRTKVRLGGPSGDAEDSTPRRDYFTFLRRPEQSRLARGSHPSQRRGAPLQRCHSATSIHEGRFELLPRRSVSSASVSESFDTDLYPSTSVSRYYDTVTDTEAEIAAVHSVYDYFEFVQSPLNSPAAHRRQPISQQPLRMQENLYDDISAHDDTSVYRQRGEPLYPDYPEVLGGSDCCINWNNGFPCCIM